MLTQETEGRVFVFCIGLKGIKMKFAWVENNQIRDVCHGDPTMCYHPDVAVFYSTEVPDDAQNGDKWVDGVLVKREPEPIVPSVSE